MAKDEILMGGLGDKLMCLLATYNVVPFGYARMGPDHRPIPVAKIWGVRGMKNLCDSGDGRRYRLRSGAMAGTS